MRVLFLSFLSSSLFLLQSSTISTTLAQPSTTTNDNDNDNDDDCMSSLSMLVIAELFVADPSIRREYTLCPNTEYVTSRLLGPGETTDGDSPITIRPNLSIKCGADGSRSNNCTVTGGVGMTGNPSNFNDDLGLGRVTIRGITFRGLKDANFHLEQFNGKVEIDDCAFLDSGAFPNIKIDGGTPSDDNDDNTPNDELLVTTFTDCLFANNTILSGENVGFTAALVWLPSQYQTTNFIGCTFLNNDFDERVASTEVEAVIGVTNGTITMERNCFIDNDVDNIGVVQTFPQQPKLSRDNYGTRPSRYICDFVGTYYLRPDGVQGGPICVFYDSAVCLAKDARSAGVTDVPTRAPVVPTVPTLVVPTPFPTIPATQAAIVPSPAPVVPSLAPVVPSLAPVVPATPAPVVPATPAPVIPATPAPVIPATPAPVPPSPAPVIPATPAPFPAPTDAPLNCGRFNTDCGQNSDCCSNNCFRTVSSPNAGLCRGNGSGAASTSKTTAKLGRNRGGAGGQSM